MDKDSKIFVAGHRGMVGSAIVRALERAGFSRLTLRSHQELDLREQGAVREFFAAQRPSHVFLAAARVGGILANDTQPADFLYDNLMIETNVIHSAFEHGVSKLLFLGSTCIYPRLAPQPMREDSLLSGPLEPTNQWYALAKIAGIKLCEAFRRQHGCDFVSAMPTNLYGPGDNFSLEQSHVIPALLRKAHEARVNDDSSIVVWGSGKPLREFLHVDDLADAALFLMQRYSDAQHVNVGMGKEISVADLARTIKEIVGFRGQIEFDASRPDGTPRKLVDTSLVNALGWRPRIALREGLADTYRWFLDNADNVRR